MNFHEVNRLADHAVLPGLASVVARDRMNIAEMLAFIAVADERKLYLAAAYPSMFSYCVGELRLSEDAAFKRIQAARTAREFPTIFAAVADGRLHLSAVVLLAPHLTRGSSGELLAHAAHKTSAEVRLLLAQRFPQPDLVTFVQAIAPAMTTGQLAPEQVQLCTGQLAPEQVQLPTGQLAPEQVQLPTGQLAPEQVRVPTGQLAPEQVASPAGHLAARLGAPEASRARVMPLSPQRFALQVTVGQATHDKLRRAQELLAHTLPSGDVAQVLDRALDALIHELERRRLAATDRPRLRRSGVNGRYIPAEVKRKVAERDGGQCTFVSESGRRCAERKFLEYDHVDAVARGGRSTAKGLRMRCRAHNQYSAECAFGKGFMQAKRQGAKRKAAVTRDGPPPPSTTLASEKAAIAATPA